MLYAAARHNLSPRGDGNNYIHQKRYELLQDTTYPREGTETQNKLELLLSSQDTTYPREGTETGLFFSSYFPLTDTTYPREGTETCKMAVQIAPTTDTTYPRQGTETLSGNSDSLLAHPTQLIPVRGRKLCTKQRNVENC